MTSLVSPVTILGPFVKRLEKPLKKLGIETMQDLIFYFPYRYEDLSTIKTIRELASGGIVTIKGTIQFIRNFRSPVKKKLITEALIADGTGSVRIIWFNQAYLVKILKAGDEVYFAGAVSDDRIGMQFVNPVYEIARETQTHTGRIVPIYSLTERITQKQLRTVIKMGLTSLEKINEWTPKEILDKYNLLDLEKTIINIHFPANNELQQRAERRVKFNNIFTLQLANTRLKSDLAHAPAYPIEFHEDATKEFVASLPFQLTNAQRACAWEIIKDMGESRPMNRLLNGDVGSGKTLVAAIAILNAAVSRKQSVLLAPTEILANQHFNTLGKLFAPYNIKMALLTASHQKIIHPHLNPPPLGRGRKEGVKAKIKKGEIDLVIGTHALLEENVAFKNLALAVIDEQHKFGVHQRQLLRNRDSNNANAHELREETNERDSKHANTHELREDGGSDSKSMIKKNDFESFECNSSHSRRIPHFLSMTATPIPRTLALTAYGDLDLSILNEMPKGRIEIQTKFVPDSGRAKTYEFIKNEIRAGRQVFCICPLIDPSDILGIKSVKETKEHLEKDIFKEFKIEMLHGKLKSADKERIMREFLDKKFDILVSTSVVEVGVDIPNATVMMIEGAERFGLSQLHQFRGRVGRGEHESYCFLFGNPKSANSTARLRTMETVHDGFALAEKDLELRGAGDALGTRQWGFDDDRQSSISDIELIKICRDAAQELMNKDSSLQTWPELKTKVEEFMSNVHPE